MSEVQIAIIDQEDTQITLAVPGVQGPAGAISSGGSANQVFYKVSGTNYDAGWTFIGNANVDAAAAIAGTKISPNFGSQTIATTGVFSHALGAAATPSLTFTGDLNTGIFSPGADQVAVATNGQGRLFVDANGSISINATGPKNPDGYNTTSYKFLSLQATTGATDRGAILELIGTGGGSPGYWLGRIGFFSTGNSYPHASIASFTDSGGDNGGALFFNTTTTANAGFPIERARIRSDGTFEIKGAGTGGISPAFSVNGSAPANSVVIDSNGRLGIGTSSPDDVLDTAAGNYRGISIKCATTAHRPTLSFLNTADSLAAYIQATGSSLAFGSMGTDYGGHTPRMTLTSTGLGIGTTGPAQELHVQASSGSGNIRVGGSAGLEINFDTSASTTSQIKSLYSTVSAAAQLKLVSGFLTFHTGTSNLEKARIDADGRLLVGTIASPAHQLQVSTDSAGKPSTNTWTIVSDERIKEEIELADLDLCYEAVKSIPLKRFKWKDEVYTEEQVRDRRKLGWIAQDVEAVFPKAVGTYEFKYNQVFEETIIPAIEEVLDNEGNVTTPAQPERIEKGELISEDVIEDCRDLNSDQLYAAMYGAIQKLMAKVETLEIEVASLKAS